MSNSSLYSAFQRFWQHVTFAIGGKANANEVVPKILTSEFYGPELPETGVEGQIFFKKVQS